MAQWLKVGTGWINFDHVAAVEDDGQDTVSLHSQLKRSSGHVSIAYQGEDAQQIRAYLGRGSVNPGFGAERKAPTPKS